MDAQEQIRFLNDMLLDEMPQYRSQAAQTPQDMQSRRYLLRCLMNVREPKALSPRFLEAQDALLTNISEGR